MVKNLPAMQEIGIQSLGQEDTLEKGMATHSSILAWEIPWTEGPGVGPRDFPVTWTGSRVRTLARTNCVRTETDFPQLDNRPL